LFARLLTCLVRPNGYWLRKISQRPSKCFIKGYISAIPLMFFFVWIKAVLVCVHGLIRENKMSRVIQSSGSFHWIEACMVELAMGSLGELF